MKKIENMTNDEFFAHLLRFSHGNTHPGMMAMFVLDSLQKMADMVIEAGLEKVRKDFGPHSFIHPDAWYQAAVDLKKALAEKYDRP